MEVTTTRTRSRVARLLAAIIVLAAAGAPVAQPRRPAIPAVADGERLFFEETFRGNGRTCATCHVASHEFTFSPSLAQAIFSTDPVHPLFQDFDSNDGNGQDFSNLLNHALVTVRIDLHQGVILPDDPNRRFILVWRGTPSVANVALTGPFLQDGRTATLQDQAAGAIAHHMRPGRTPGRRELDAIARFQEGIFTPLRLRALRDSGAPPDATPGFSVPVESPAAERGRAVFQEHCTRCHSFEIMHRPSDPNAPVFPATFVSEANRLGLPRIRLGFTGAAGGVTIVETPDPGRAAVTGAIEDLNTFETPMLRGLKHTAPYFHDNSAPTLRDVIDHYNEFFGFGIIRDQRDDLIAFLELL